MPNRLRGITARFCCTFSQRSWIDKLISVSVLFLFHSSFYFFFPFYLFFTFVINFFPPFCCCFISAPLRPRVFLLSISFTQPNQHLPSTRKPVVVLWRQLTSTCFPNQVPLCQTLFVFLSAVSCSSDFYLFQGADDRCLVESPCLWLNRAPMVKQLWIIYYSPPISW